MRKRWIWLLMLVLGVAISFLARPGRDDIADLAVDGVPVPISEVRSMLAKSKIARGMSVLSPSPWVKARAWRIPHPLAVTKHRMPQLGLANNLGQVVEWTSADRHAVVTVAAGYADSIASRKVFLLNLSEDGFQKPGECFLVAEEKTGLELFWRKLRNRIGLR